MPNRWTKSETRVVLSAVLLILVGCGPVSRDAAPVQGVAITGVNVIDVDAGSALRDHTVVITGTRIQAVGPTGMLPVPKNVRLVDGRGQYLIPGLWDMHVHTAIFGPEVLPLFLAYGVTGIRDAGSPDSIYVWRDEVRQGSRLGPRMWITGRFLMDSPEERPHFNGQGLDSPEGARDAVRQRQREGADYIKIPDSFMRREIWLAIADEAQAQGLPLVSHVPIDVPFPEAVAHGLRCIEHTLGLPLLVTASEAELRRRIISATDRDAALLATDVMALSSADSSRIAALALFMRDKGVVLDPTVTDSRAMATAATGQWNDDPRMRFLASPLREKWRGAPNDPFFAAPNTANFAWLYKRVQPLIANLHAAGVPVLAGTDAGSTFDFPGSDLHSELVELVVAGLTPLEALRTATTNAVRYMGLADSLGSIASGHLADLVILDGNPLEDIRNTSRVVSVIANGRYLDRATLDRLLTEGDRTNADGRGK